MESSSDLFYSANPIWQPYRSKGKITWPKSISKLAPLKVTHNRYFSHLLKSKSGVPLHKNPSHYTLLSLYISGTIPSWVLQWGGHDKNDYLSLFWHSSLVYSTLRLPAPSLQYPTTHLIHTTGGLPVTPSPFILPSYHTFFKHNHPRSSLSYVTRAPR